MPVHELVAIVVMAGVVATLGILQYRWTGDISRVEQQRLNSSLTASVRGFDQEFSYDFRQLCESFEIDPEGSAASVESRLAKQYVAWNKVTSSPGLVSSLHIWRPEPAHDNLQTFDPLSGRFHKVAWTAQMAPLRQFLLQQAARLSREDTQSSSPAQLAAAFDAAHIDDRTALYYPWTFFDDARFNESMYDMTALVRPIFQLASSPGDVSRPVRVAGFVIVELGGEFIDGQYLPGLVERNFGNAALRNFDVAVRTSKAPYKPIYLSTPSFPLATAVPDAAVNLFDAVGEEARRRGHAPLQAGTADRQWQLVVQHPSGSVGVAVAKWRTRSLGISFGLLTVLAASMILIFIVARRAERLAKLQMEFVAGVSHELCTPLSVITSASENLVDGVVDDPRQVREYGTMIRDQSRRLERLVDEVLLYAAGKFGRSGYELRPVEIADMVTHSLSVSEPMLHDAGFQVETEIGTELPAVLADPAAVSKCMENLLSNAVKYAGGERWLAVRTRVVQAKDGEEVQISVEDRGLGVPSADIANIFEPFYRVQAVRDRQIRGVGLGLYLVKRMMEGMGGRVSVASELGRGTSFTLHFPVNGAAAVPHVADGRPVVAGSNTPDTRTR